jgi:hypothetical protein
MGNLMIKFTQKGRFELSIKNENISLPLVRVCSFWQWRDTPPAAVTLVLVLHRKKVIIKKQWAR